MCSFSEIKDWKNIELYGEETWLKTKLYGEETWKNMKNCTVKKHFLMEKLYGEETQGNNVKFAEYMCMENQLWPFEPCLSVRCLS